MRARGMTLLEVLIAIAVILTLAALSMPILLHSLDERAFVSAADVIRSQILMARAHAQRSGHAVEVVYLPDAHQLVVREIQPEDPAGESAPSRSLDKAGRPDDARDLNGDRAVLQGDLRSLPERWARQELGDHLDLRFREPTRVLNGTASAFRFPEDTDSTLVAPARFLALAPDGTAMQTRLAWLTDGVSRVAKLTVNPWTGVPEVTRLQPLEAQQPAPQPGPDDPLERDGPLSTETSP
jgi:prepilin-type N-terminal cleavage/methylation domain-containing protein